ncbi:MAG TPA: tripartite tricarboxylate transporter substrate binding protein [Burkholderiaceae bacterium]|nr:tripartite tricarboxylate transporter substrate binding protein [Burkholderiaceae bacterium]
MSRRPLDRREWIASAVAGCSALVSLPARAARGGAFPARAVRLVVPYSVGVGPDVVARSVATPLAQRWRHPVLVDNKPGAAGIVAFADVRRTPPDGHTLFLADSGTLAVNPLLHARLPYDPQRDLAPLTLLFRATFVLWVGGASRFRGIAELLDTARRTSAAVSYASLGNGHPSQVAIETLAHAAGVRLLHVPFKDAGALFAAVASGEVDLTAFSVNSVAGLAASGRLRPLAVAARSRLVSHPQLPTLAEAGAPAVEMHPWAALVTVADTAPPVLQQLQRDIVAILESPDVRQRARDAGFELTPSAPQAVLDRMHADAAQVAPLVDEGRLVPV